MKWNTGTALESCTPEERYGEQKYAQYAEGVLEGFAISDSGNTLLKFADVDLPICVPASWKPIGFAVKSGEIYAAGWQEKPYRDPETNRIRVVNQFFLIPIKL